MTKIKAFFFDQDGVIIDTEKDGHRVAFNKTFFHFGFDFQWSVDEYHKLLQVGGGKERMRHYLYTKGFGRPVAPDEEDVLIKEMHRFKTDKFIELIENSEMPLRPGIKRIMEEVKSLGLVLAICTTSNQRAAQAVSKNMLSDIKFDFILAGDMVSKKKPDPEIYNLALAKTGFTHDECIVIEDSRNGVTAAKAAGMHVVATTNFYTQNEDLSAADIVVSCLGVPGGEKGKLTAGCGELDYDGVLNASQLVNYFNRI